MELCSEDKQYVNTNEDNKDNKSNKDNKDNNDHYDEEDNYGFDEHDHNDFDQDSPQHKVLESNENVFEDSKGSKEIVKSISK